MSCNCEYGQCNQSFGCPVRSTPINPPDSSKEIETYSRMTLGVQVLLWIVVLSFTVMACYNHPELFRIFF